MNRKLSIFLLAGALLAGASCTKELDNGTETPGKYDPVVHFGLATDYDASLPQTKTAYSNETVFVGTERRERINWITWGTEGDVVRIASSKGVTKDNKNSVDYKVVANARTNNGSSDQSEAEATPFVDADILYWKPADEDHYFFAAYPSPDYVADPVNRPMTFDLATDGKSAAIGGIVPEEQGYIGKGSGTPPTTVNGSFEYAPVMKDAYMYAASKVAGKDVGVKKVPLNFKPLFNAYTFYFFSGDDPANADGAQKFKIKRVALVSENPDDVLKSSALAGEFKVKVEASSTNGLTGDFTLTDSTNTKRGVYIDIPELERKALETDTLKITLFALPVDQTYLTVEVSFEDGNGDERVRKLHLQKSANQFTNTSDGWHILPATRKLYVKSGIPDIEYIFQVTQLKEDAFDTEGETKDGLYTVRSYRKRWDRAQRVEVTEPWPWKAVKYNYEGPWVSNRPVMVTLDKDAEGDLQGEKGDGRVPDPSSADSFEQAGDVLFQVTFNKHITDDPWYDSETELGNDEVSGAINLGNYNWETGTYYTGYDKESDPYQPYETANCYVVSGAGWYKIPVVYGNAYQGGYENVPAYESYAASSDGILSGRFMRANGSGGQTNKITGGPWISAPSPRGIGNVWFRYPHLVWQDVKDLVTVPQSPDQEIDKDTNEYQKDYLYFKVNESALDNLAGGNAVVAVCNSAGVPVWSWHIWVIPKNTVKTQEVFYWKDPSYMQDEHTPLPGRMTQLGSNEMMNINLGYVSTKPSRFCMVRFEQQSSGKQGQINLIQKGDPSTTSAIYYQWGRKDPMMSISAPQDDGYGGITYAKDIYLEGSGTPISSQPVVPSLPMGGWSESGRDAWSETRNNIGFSIEEPGKMFVANGSDYQRSWSGVRMDNLWDNAILEKTANELDHVGEDHDNTVKTIYDPCPPGFKVPNEYAFTGFNKVAMDRQVYNASVTGDEDESPSDIINGIEASFYIGYKTIGDSAEPLMSEGMWLYCHPTDQSRGVIFFPALGRLAGFGGDFDAGAVQSMYQEGMYWTSAPYAGPNYGGYQGRYGRAFVMRRADDGSTSAGLPQCIPVYTLMGSPVSGASGFLRTHALQVRPIRDKFTKPYVPPSLGGFTIGGDTYHHNGDI